MGANQLDPNDGGFDPADDEKNERIDDIQNPQTLVINRGDPFMQPLRPKDAPLFLHSEWLSRPMT